MQVEIKGFSFADEGHALFNLNVSMGDLQWKVRRRFREFRKLHKELIGLPQVKEWLVENSKMEKSSVGSKSKSRYNLAWVPQSKNKSGSGNLEKDQYPKVASKEEVEKKESDENESIGTLPSAGLPKFPRRELLTKHSTKETVLHLRVEQLQDYMNKLLSLDPIAQNPPPQLVSFLGMLAQSAKKSLEQRIHITKLPEIAFPGDVLLFKSLSAAASLQRRVTNSNWDHVAIVVQRKDIKGLEMLEATSDGVQSFPLIPRLLAYSDGYADPIAIRRLQVPRTDMMLRGLRRFQSHVEGMPYYLSVNKILYTKRQQGAANKNDEEDCLEGESASKRKKEEGENDSLTSLTITDLGESSSLNGETENISLSTLTINNSQTVNPSCENSVLVQDHATEYKNRVSRLGSVEMLADTKQEDFFCSELVAEAFHVMGLLPKTRQANYYWPVSFQSGGHIDKALSAHTGVSLPLSDPILIDCAILPVLYSHSTTTSASK